MTLSFQLFRPIDTLRIVCVFGLLFKLQETFHQRYRRIIVAVRNGQGTSTADTDI